MLHPIELENSGVVYRFVYSDGFSRLRTFPSDEEARWFAHNEGDHLMTYIKI